MCGDLEEGGEQRTVVGRDVGAQEGWDEGCPRGKYTELRGREGYRVLKQGQRSSTPVMKIPGRGWGAENEG